MNPNEPMPAVSVALVRDDTVLLVRRGRPPGRGLYAFPGGRVEAGESLAEAARRELFEETGLRAGALSPVLEILIEPEAGSAPLSFRLQVFSAPWVGGEPVAADDAEEAGFYTLPALRLLPLAGSVEAVACTLLGERAPALPSPK